MEQHLGCLDIPRPSVIGLSREDAITITSQWRVPRPPPQHTRLFGDSCHQLECSCVHLSSAGLARTRRPGTVPRT